MCFSSIMLDSVIGVNKKYYLETLVEKHTIKNNKTENLINDDSDLSPSDNGSDDESHN